MPIIRTVKDLKESIKDLPDDMLVKGYPDNRGDSVSYFLMTKDMMTEEELNDGYPDGFQDMMMVSVGD